MEKHEASKPTHKFSLDTLYLHAGMLLSQLVTEDGRIFASQDPRFHHYFARDSMITASFIADTFRLNPTPQNRILFEKAKKAVVAFWKFQNADGKIPHEIKPFKGNEQNPLYLNKFYSLDGDYLVNNDSIDATPLTLIVTAQYLDHGSKEYEKYVPSILKAFEWLITNMQTNDGWVCYIPNPTGLVSQGWMDSRAGIVDKFGDFPEGPIALVEVQALMWKACRVWSAILKEEYPEKSSQLLELANDLKKRFNQNYIISFTDNDQLERVYLAHALDGKKQPLDVFSINPVFVLWAIDSGESILEDRYIDDVVSCLSSDTMYHEVGGVRTFALGQKHHDPERYHNGKNVFWPFITGIAAWGIYNTGEKHHDIARSIMIANIKSILYWSSFIEQFYIEDDGTYHLFRNGVGDDSGCKNQTWTVAAFWWMLNHPLMAEELNSFRKFDDTSK